MLLGKAQVDAEDLGDEERGLVAAGAGAKLDDDVFIVIGILRQQHDLQFFFDRLELRFERGEFFLGHLSQVWIGEHRLCLGDTVGNLAVLTILFNDRLHVAVFLGDGLKLLLIVDEVRVGHVARERVITGFHLGEAVKHINPLDKIFCRCLFLQMRVLRKEIGRS